MIYKTGDLVEAAKNGEVDFLLHGCNCLKIWGAGIAKQIKTEFCEAYKADCLDYRSPIEKIGSYSSAKINDLTVVNLYTQFDIATKISNGRRFEYGGFKRCLEQFCADFYLGNKTIGLPMIGSGLGKGGWHYIEEILSLYDTEGVWVVYSLGEE